MQDCFKSGSGRRCVEMKRQDYIKELNAKDEAALREELLLAKKELFNLRFQNATNQLENTSRIKEVRKNIARITFDCNNRRFTEHYTSALDIDERICCPEVNAHIVR